MALADQLLAAWLKQEGHEEPPPPAEHRRAEQHPAGAVAADPAAPPAPPPERLRLGERVLLDRDTGALRGRPPGGRYSRRRLRTPAAHGIEQLTLTVASATEQPCWLRLEAEHLPTGAGIRTSSRVPVPELARGLLPLLDATDGPVALSARPRVIAKGEVDALIDELCDPERRLPVVVASVPPAVAMDTWLAEVVHPLLRQLTGLASLYVLGHAALPLFNVALEYHKVYGGAVRTYLPEVDPASRHDGARHPVMPRRRIDEDVRRAAALLAREPRRFAAELPLPDLLAAVPVLQPPPMEPRPAHPGPAQPRPARPGPAESGAGAGSGTVAAPRGTVPGQASASAADRCERQSRADELEQVRRSLDSSRRRQARLLAETDQQDAVLRHVSAQVRALAARLCTLAGPDALDHAGLAADVCAEEECAPGSFGELVCRFAEFPLLEFTGDEKETLALDGQCDGSGWARLTWDGLTALQEYAAAAVRGEAGGDFKQWCEHTPAGCHHFPPRKAVRGESRTVTSHGKWKRQRMLPVPACVDSSRRAFMGAHLRIGGGGTAPRVHYLDDCSRSGRIYVGYIGLHLTNTRTN
ncbi:hypothetical protein AB0D08_24435 [Kitasatospora sp. NPDC048540]|uniref:hypothetical protein n=1 Tax=Kitasatospora sp. NPDC048540 TaxID=3155634 RepID=UPI0033F14FE2